MSSNITLTDIAAARKRIDAQIVPLRITRSNALSQRMDQEILLAHEYLQTTGAFKLRGAMNAMRKQPGQKLFVCASAGNHAQGVAYMCSHLQVRGVIFMPVTTPEQKIMKTKMFGGAHVDTHWVHHGYRLLHSIGHSVELSVE